MSGGRFEYSQHVINDIINSIESTIAKNGKEKTREELKDEGWKDTEWYKKYPEDLCHYKYPDEVINKMKEGIHHLKIAYIYAQRIDWLLSGDDGEDTFLERLKKELEDYEKISL